MTAKPTAISAYSAPSCRPSTRSWRKSMAFFRRHRPGTERGVLMIPVGAATIFLFVGIAGTSPGDDEEKLLQHLRAALGQLVDLDRHRDGAVGLEFHLPADRVEGLDRKNL